MMGQSFGAKTFAPICTAESVYIRKCSTLNGCFVCLYRTVHFIFLHFTHIYIITYMFTNKITYTPISVKEKFKITPLRATKMYRGCGSITPLILNLGTIRR